MTEQPLVFLFLVERTLERLGPVWRPHDGQRAFLLSGARFKVLACGRRWGKTEACAAQIVATMMEAAPTRHLILAPTIDQARLLFDRTLDLLDRWCEAGGCEIRARVVRTPYPKLTFGPHRLAARSGHLGRALRGNEATHIVVDEAAYVPEELVTEVAMPMLATTDGLLTLIGTPNGRNHFWRFFEMGARGEHGVWSRAAPSWESPFVSQSYLDVQRDLISERAFRIEYGAEFLDSAGRVFKTEAVEACMVARLPRDPEPPFVVGVDWARYGDFTTVVVLDGSREDAQLVAAERFHGMSWADQVARVAALVRSLGPCRVLCDATGVGDPAIEMLRAEVGGAHIAGLVFTPGEKAALIDGLVWMFERGALRMEPNPELLRELQHFEAKPTGSGHVRLGSAGGYHDDLVIGLALAARLLPKRYRARPLVGAPRRFSARRPTARTMGGVW